MKSLTLYFVIFILFLSTVFGVCEVFGGWSGKVIKYHPVYQLNDRAEKNGKEVSYGNIIGYVYYRIYDEINGPRLQSSVSSRVSMMAIGLAFRGFASISGTA